MDNFDTSKHITRPRVSSSIFKLSLSTFFGGLAVFLTVVIATAALLFLKDNTATQKDEIVLSDTSWPASGTLSIGQTAVSVSVARTPAEREQGLSGVGAIAPDEGKLFVFDAPGRYGFWMKDMRFSLDIIWIDAAGRVVGESERLLPESYPEIFYPPRPVQYVLETNAGFVQKNKIKLGSEAVFSSGRSK